MQKFLIIMSGVVAACVATPASADSWDCQGFDHYDDYGRFISRTYTHCGIRRTPRPYYGGYLQNHGGMWGGGWGGYRPHHYQPRGTFSAPPLRRGCTGVGCPVETGRPW